MYSDIQIIFPQYHTLKYFTLCSHCEQHNLQIIRFVHFLEKWVSLPKDCQHCQILQLLFLIYHIKEVQCFKSKLALHLAQNDTIRILLLCVDSLHESLLRWTKRSRCERVSFYTVCSIRMSHLAGLISALPLVPHWGNLVSLTAALLSIMKQRLITAIQVFFSISPLLFKRPRGWTAHKLRQQLPGSMASNEAALLSCSVFCLFSINGIISSN